MVQRCFSFLNTEGIAIVCGEVSDNLEVIDIDCKNDPAGEMWNDFYHLAKGSFPELFDRLVIAKTIHKGYHIYYRCSRIEGNQQLSRNSKREVLIETRGEGGYVIAAPTPGYEFVQGEPGKIPAITPEERLILLSIGRSFDESPKPEVKPASPDLDGERLSPFDDYNQRVDVIALLEKHSWRVVRQKGESIYLERPGKSENSVSASFHNRMKLFYPFTTSSVFDVRQRL